MNWEVEFYATESGDVPVEEFQLTLPPKHRAKSLHDIDQLARFGTALREPHVKPIKGGRYRGLWELRTKFAGDISRIFYFLAVGNRFILLHGYIKKDDKLDVRELGIAKRYMEDFLKRQHDEQN